MFFEPPRVKSLSRYAEYGSYLGNRHFLIMLAVAIIAHLSIIAIYSMVPRQEVIKIPVRALNIKLTGGGSLAAAQMPVPGSMPEVKSPAGEEEEARPTRGMKSVREESPVAAVDSALKAERVKRASARTQAAEAQKKTAASPEFTLSTPKRFVRPREEVAGRQGARGQGNGTSDGNGSEVNGDVGGSEVIQRYTQTISQWIKNHQIYARAVCGEVQEAGGQCEARGQVVVRLRIDRDGHILYNSVDRTSGKELVDQAAIAMVRASDPVPSVPGSFPGTQLEFLIAVQVDLAKHR